MENNWKWYEQQNPQQNAQQSEQPQQSQPNYGQYNYSTNANPGYNAYGAGNGGSGNGSKPKKFVTMTQMIVTVIVAALLFTGAGLAIGRGISANNELPIRRCLITQQQRPSRITRLTRLP